ncbi:general secretion pathway protein L [Pseudomonas cuatrocienegasensis]|uniref:Type II secretion system protein L n=1 Tax=Pseudomonas cuatrocienegasensis TaxID=543360 RepID=A0ABY1BQQ7_9PSED|nr:MULTISPECIES: type II secretion system protein GspL [Pseudomonas]OEC32991.1 type II secretion system protein GspL [Pseudomonas sp. 21C1]SER39553.1 general secretion pathway protein L [Pseudomonas cuatrocienegasensis]
MNLSCVFLPPAACAGVDVQLPVRQVRAGQSQTLPFAEACAEQQSGWTLVLPVEAVTACAVHLPTRKARWLRQALPFAVEEQLADDIEQLHLALGELLADGRYRVYALRRAWLSDWLAVCPTPPGRILMDADCLPDEGTQLLWLDGRWLLGGSTQTRLALDPEAWGSLADRYPRPHCCVQAGADVQPLAADQVLQLDDAHLWLAGQARGTNLAQGDFAPATQDVRWQSLRPLLALLGLWLVLQWGFNLAQGWHLQREADAYADASAALYRELFPQDHRLVNLRAQFDQHLSEAGAGQSGLLSQLDTIGALLGAQVQVEQLDYRSTPGELSLQVTAPGFAELEQLRERLQGADMAVQLGAASREANGVSARLVIGG